jgi:colicin import membrane protein
MEAPSLSPRRSPREDLIAGMGGSILAHAIIFSLALIVPWLTPKSSIQNPFAFMAVDLVSMQDLGMGSAPAKGKTSHQAEGAKSQSAQKPSSPAQAKSAPLVPVKRLNIGEPVKKAESQIKKIDAPDIPKVAEHSINTASLDKSLDKLIPKPKTPSAPHSSMGEVEKASPAKETASKGSGSGQTPSNTSSEHKAGDRSGGSNTGSAEGNPGGAAQGAQLALARRAYYMAIRNAIRQHWALPEFLKAQKLEVVLVVVLRRDGKVMDLQFEKKSGQPLFDESVERAVRKADPLPPFPEIYSPAKEEIELRFRPQDLS